MKLYTVVFDFCEQHREYTNSVALSNHPQIEAYMKKHRAVKMSPNAFLLKTELEASEILNTLMTGIDRNEWLYVFEVHCDNWHAFSDKRKLKKINETVEFVDLSNE